MKRSLPAYVYAKGKRGYLYFVRHGVCTRIQAAPGSADFAAEYARLMRGHVATPNRTISKLIALYRASSKWAKKKPNTRKSYERSMDYLAKSAGNVDPATLKRVHINEMRDALSDKPTDANRKIGMLSVLLEHAIDVGWLVHNPAKGVQQLETTGRVRMPWPQTLINAYRETAKGRDLLLFEMLIGTGQRIGDVLAMQWGHVDGDGIMVKQGKTGASLFIPFTDRLRGYIASAPRKGLFIICQSNGLPVSYQLAWKDIKAIRDKIGAQAYDIHALRYAAASEIASIPGMTSEHVKAITGHSTQAMVMHYAGPAMQKARAEEAQAARNGTKTKQES